MGNTCTHQTSTSTEASSGPNWPDEPTKPFISRLNTIAHHNEFDKVEIKAIYDGIDKQDYTYLNCKIYRDLELIISDIREIKSKNCNRRLKSVKVLYVEPQLSPPVVVYGFDFYDSVAL